MKKGGWLVFFIGFLLFDIGSKAYAVLKIPFMSAVDLVYPFGGLPIFFSSAVTFSLNYVTNTGAAWGLFPGSSGILFVLRAVIIICLFVYLLKAGKKWITTLPLWLILTGAVGNALDYAIYGHVIDFLHFTFWGTSFPVFNFADAYITCGVVFVFLFPAKKQTPANNS